MRYRRCQKGRSASAERLEPRRHLAGQTYYVSPTGDDLAAGTSPSTPWRTLANVNALALSAGDAVLLQGGTTINGTLKLDHGDVGTAAVPITISSYGTGRATLYAGEGDGIDVIGTSGVAISNLNIRGSGSLNMTSQGINLYNDRTSGGRLTGGITITQVEVSGFGLRGIGIGAATTSYGFENVSVTHASLHDDNEAGLFSYAGAYTTNPAPYGLAHANLYVAYVEAYDNGGNAVHLASGNGIELGNVYNATVEHCVAYDNGKSNFNYNSGPVGIWTYNSDRVVIQYNESYANASAHIDGDGFDLDGGTTNSVLQYNYSHDNAGAGYLLCQFANGTTWGNNVVRYNVSQNDGGRLNYAAITMWAPTAANSVNNCEIYGNTIFNAKTGANAPRAIDVLVATANVHVRNNIFAVGAGGSPVRVTAAGTGLVFQGNDYWAGSTATAGISWLGTTYATLGAWRSATGQEKVGATAVGLNVDPKLVKAGGGTAVGLGGDLTGLSVYRLSGSSPLINAGVNLNVLGVTPPATDFYGQPVPDGSGYDIGANEADVVAPTAAATLSAVTMGAATYSFRVSYADNVGLTLASVASTNVLVTGPNGYSQLATLTYSAAAGKTVAASYAVTAPGGSWDAADAGVYTVTMMGGQVLDTSGNGVAAGVLGTFTVAGTGPLVLADTGAAYLKLSADGASLQVWDAATPGNATPARTVALSTLSGVNVPAGTRLTIDAGNGSLPASVAVTFIAGAASTVTQVGTSGSMATVVNYGATAQFAGTQTVGSLAVSAGGRAVVVDPAGGGRSVLVVGTLSLASTGTIDVTDNDLVAIATPIGTVWSAAAAGYASGTWAGQGLTSSTAAGNADRTTGVAVVATDGSPVDGVAVPAGAVRAKLAYYGDANLSGTVDIADYTRADAGLIGGLTGWANGDVNYDGVVDGNDLTLMDHAYAATRSARAASALATPATAVVDPTRAATPAASVAASRQAAITAASANTQRLNDDDELRRRKAHG